MKSIGLCMIVKNEAHVIERCLESVLPLIDHVLICDTGSTDGTQEKIRLFLKQHGIPGQVQDHEWRNFAHNRSRALEEMRRVESVDYTLMIDADEVLVFDDGFDSAVFKRGLSADLYNIRTELGSSYIRPQLFSNRMPYHFRGVLHEYLECENIRTRQTVRGFHNKPIQDSARNRNPDKYRQDANALKKALETETDAFLISRYTFYLAQSLRDAEEPEEALIWYLRRAELGFWFQEIYVALLSAARLMERLKYPAAEVIDTYLRAHETCAERAEALHGLARYCRLASRYQQSALFGKKGLETPRPESGLFIERWIYDYGLLDEYSISAYWAGQYSESLAASRRLIAENKFPEQERQRILQNAAFALAKVEEAKKDAVAPQTRQRAEATTRTSAVQAPLPSGEEKTPTVLVAILAKQKEPVLPFYLKCIEALDYPKSAISLYIRTNNNRDNTASLLREWVDRVGTSYRRVEFDDSDVPFSVESFGVHEWNELRFRVLGNIRQTSLDKAREWNCDFYFTADVDNFLRPHTLKSLVSVNLPIAAPLLRHVDPEHPYSNYHSEVTASGYFKNDDVYYQLLSQTIQGLIEVPVVHCTYLIKTSVIPRLSYDDNTGRHEYVIFSDSARKNKVAQFLDNRDVYGYLTLEETPYAARILLGEEIDEALARSA